MPAGVCAVARQPASWASSFANPSPAPFHASGERKMGRLLLPSQPPEARIGQQEPLRWSRSSRAGEEEQGRQGGGRVGGFSTRSGGTRTATRCLAAPDLGRR
nr:unnamed protein product [Digitaria exilis]